MQQRLQFDIECGVLLLLLLLLLRLVVVAIVLLRSHDSIDLVEMSVGGGPAARLLQRTVGQRLDGSCFIGRSGASGGGGDGCSTIIIAQFTHHLSTEQLHQ